MKTATFDDKVANSAAIVMGKVVKQESRFDDAHRWILTYTTFRIEKSFKGMTGEQEITVVTPGGTVGDLHQETIGIPDFAVGRENVVFLRNSNAGPTVLYFDQGAYDVGKDEHGDRIIAPVPSDAVHIDTQRGAAVVPEGPKSVNEFEGAVRAAQRRIANQQMELIRRQQAAKQPAFGDFLRRNAFLIGIAILGAAFATWRLMRR